MFDGLKTGIRNWLFGDMLNMTPAERERYTRYSELLAYQRGQQRQPLKTRPDAPNDNLIVNWCGLVIERSVSMLFGEDITFDLPGEGAETPEDTFIQAVLAANKQAILLHRIAQFGGVLGTCYVKLLPERIEKDGKHLPKLVALNPAYMEIETVPDDKDEPTKYIQRYTIGAGDRAVAHRITTARYTAKAQGVNAQGEEYALDTGEPAGWTETHEVNSRETGGRWAQISAEDWPYPFAPIVHWQNLPDAFSCYGQSDLADVLPIQDRYNFNASNISKIVRFHAHPKTWGVGTQSKEIEWGADKMVWLAAAGAGQTQPHIENLEMQSDLASSREFGKDLREALFTVTRTTDPATIKDTIGALTNFGLRVLFKDELAKIRTKRALYGDGLLEVVRRLLVLANMANTDPGEIVWPDPLPVNETEQTAALKTDVEMGLASKQTASGERGYDWEVEQERIEEETQAAQNVGANVLRAFGQGGGASLFGAGGAVNDQPA